MLSGVHQLKLRVIVWGIYLIVITAGHLGEYSLDKHLPVYGRYPIWKIWPGSKYIWRYRIDLKVKTITPQYHFAVYQPKLHRIPIIHPRPRAQFYLTWIYRSQGIAVGNGMKHHYKNAGQLIGQKMGILVDFFFWNSLLFGILVRNSPELFGILWNCLELFGIIWN